MELLLIWFILGFVGALLVANKKDEYYIPTLLALAFFGPMMFIFGIAFYLLSFE